MGFKTNVESMAKTTCNLYIIIHIY